MLTNLKRPKEKKERETFRNLLTTITNFHNLIAEHITYVLWESMNSAATVSTLVLLNNVGDDHYGYWCARVCDSPSWEIKQRVPFCFYPAVLKGPHPEIRLNLSVALRHYRVTDSDWCRVLFDSFCTPPLISSPAGLLLWSRKAESQQQK